MIQIGLLLVVVTIQTTFAYFTARDAWSRGHDERRWFLLALIFSVPAIVIYLLTRRDQRLPEADRPSQRSKRWATVVGLYIGVFLIASMVASLGSFPIANALDADTTATSTEPLLYQTVSTAIQLGGVAVAVGIHAADRVTGGSIIRRFAPNA
ncbi:hypothetical protein [Halobellus sp. EA9]|uniref:hypothetical protein n=1 Tax=Halobellus sp. EA9 TaxID=3421647 RepID=UPI003EBD863A